MCVKTFLNLLCLSIIPISGQIAYPNRCQSWCGRITEVGLYFMLSRYFELQLVHLYGQVQTYIHPQGTPKDRYTDIPPEGAFTHCHHIPHHSDTHTHTYAHKHKHTRRQTYLHTNTHVMLTQLPWTYIQTRIWSHKKIQIHNYTPALLQAHTHIHTHTHTHTHIYTGSQTHINIQISNRKEK